MTATSPSWLERLISFMYNELTGGTPDTYATVKPSSVSDNLDGIVPMVRTEGLPYLGPDHNKLILKAEKLFPVDPDDVNRIKWLKAIHTLRNSKTGYIMDLGQHDKPFGKWGLNSTFTGMGGTP